MQSLKEIKMEDTLVTIVIASYNNSKYIARCLDTVVHQTYNNLEIIIIDDGSTDNTKVICQRFMIDRRVHFVEKQNGGLSSSRLLGLEQANGVYISFIDADDYLTPRYVEDFVNSFEFNGGDVAVCSTRFEDADGREIPTPSFQCTNSEGVLQLKHENLLSGFPLNIILSDSWNKMYRAQFLRTICVRFELPRGFNGTDTVFNWKVAFHQPYYLTIEAQNYVHVIYKSSAVHRKNKKLFQGFQHIVEQLLCEAEKLDNVTILCRCINTQYSDYIRYSLTDELQESASVANNIKTVIEFKRKEKSFRKKHPNLAISVSLANTISSKIFVFLYRYTTILLLLYLYARSNAIERL